MKLLFTTLLLLSSVLLRAQEMLPCGTQPTQKQIERINERMRSRSTRSRSMAAAVTNVAISAHVIRRSDGSGGLSEADLNDAMTGLNNFYANANLNFFILGDIRYIDNDQYYDFDADDESVMGAANDVENTINIYFANTVSSGESALCGYAYFSGGPDRILMNNGCTTNGSTFPHEVGHYFDLYHTHGTTNNGTTDELVDGSNCSSSGDRICDTPADPNLSGVVDYNSGACDYTGTATDANDDEYTPDTGNIMSYSLKACRTHFSDGQYDVIADTYTNERSYLISKNVAADFDADLTTICSGGAVTFSDQSISPSSWSWSFPGGTPSSSTVQNPEITYSTAGTYNVTLTVTNASDEEDIKTFTNYIVVEDATATLSEELTIGFETGEEVRYRIENEDNDDTFEVSSTAISGSKSLRMNFLNYSRVGEEDYLILNDIDLSNGHLFRLSFDRAYAYYNEEFRDSLAIVITESCAYNWQLFKGYSSEELATANPHTLSFIPTSTEWEGEQLLIEFDESWEGAQVAFKTINGYGNNLYLDQIALEPVHTDAEIQDIVVSCTSEEDAADGEIEILASGSGALTFSLDGASYQSGTTFSSLTAGDYTLYTKQDDDLVSQEDFTIVSASSIEVEITTDENGHLVATSEATSFQWFFAGEAVAGATSSTLDFQGGGIYFVVATTDAGCSAKSEEFTILDAPLVENTYQIYPNPVTNVLYLDRVNDPGVILEIIDLSGKVVLSQVAEAIGQTVVDVERLHAGIYVLQLRSNADNFQYKFRKL